MTPEGRAAISAAAKARWANPEFRARLSAIAKARCQDPEYRARLSAIAKAHHAKPEVRQRIAERTKARWNDPVERQKLVAAIKKGTNQPHQKQRLADQSRANRADPEFRARLSATLKSPEVTAKRMATRRANGHEAVIDALSPVDKRFYAKLRLSGLSRDAALAEIKRAQAVAPPETEIKPAKGVSPTAPLKPKREERALWPPFL